MCEPCTEVRLLSPYNQNGGRSLSGFSPNAPRLVFAHVAPSRTLYGGGCKRCGGFAAIRLCVCEEFAENRFQLLFICIDTSIEVRLWGASLLWRSGTTALPRWWLGDGASSNALSISLFTPIANPVAKRWCSRQARGHGSCPMMAIPCRCSSGRMKPSYGKANP